MRAQSAVSWIAIVGTLASWTPRAAGGQQLALAARTPRFFYAPSTAAKPLEIDVSRNAVLGQVISLHSEHTTVGGLLADIQRQTGLTFAYDHDFPATRPFTLEAKSITVAAALGAILAGTGVDVVLTPTGHVWLTETRPPTPPGQEGTIVGRVTDKRTGDPIAGATVTLDPARQSATTGIDGRYRFANLSPGSYTVRARYIGYRALAASTTVRVDQAVVVDFLLEKSAQQLDEVVTTGTLVPTEVKALPTPISVISADQIAERHPQALLDVVRQAVPTAVAFDNPFQPVQTFFSVRGVSSLGQGSVMKILVDGVEATNFRLTPVDPASIERIEVVRGPQAATLYGSDAAGGVIQIFTKRGHPGLTRPHVDAQAELGIAQTPYDGHGGVLRQNYTGSVRGGGQDVSYNFGGGFTRLADYLPNGEISRQSAPSLYGGIHFARGIMAGDLSARYYLNKLPQVFNPLILTTGVASLSRPNFQPNDFTNDTYGTRITVSPAAWWRNQITLGVDRSSLEQIQAQPRLADPGDTLYVVGSTDSRKISLGYNASVSGTLNGGLGGTLTLGVDHYDQRAGSFFTSRAVNTQGTIVTSPAGSITESRRTITNTGYFAQAQLSLRDAVFLTGGLRAEENSTFGVNLGTPLLPRVGLAVVQRVGQTTVKLRGSFGRGIRAPSAGASFGTTSASSITLANPLLGPEQQRGWDVGADLMFGGRGSLSVTGYNQTAKDLIVFVQVANTPLPTFQNQNIGRVANRGVELEGALNLGALLLKAQYGYVHAQIEDLGPNVAASSNLQVGDRPLRAPTHTAGAVLTLTPLVGTTLTGGLTYVGSYRNIDNIAQLRCFGGTGPCQPTTRDYVVDFPGFAKVNATLTQRLTRKVDGFVSVENLTNNQAFEGGNIIPVMGRITMVGLHAAY